MRDRPDDPEPAAEPRRGGDARGAGGVQEKLAEAVAEEAERHPGAVVEVFATDEHRVGRARSRGDIGLKPILRRVWAPRGQRPVARGLVANRKRTCRLYTEQGVRVRTKKRRKLPRRDRIAPQVPERPMQRWSLDFVSDQLADCRRFRVLNIVDDHSCFCPRQFVDVSISGTRVARYLDDLALLHGPPEEIVFDNCPEGTSRAMFDRSERTGVRLRFIEPAKPVRDTPSSRA